jgi:PhoH-like ATPase
MNERTKNIDANKVFGEAKADHRILNAALGAVEENPGRPVVLVSKDINLRLKAKALNLTAEDFETKTGLWVDNLYMPTLLNGLQKMCLEGFFAPRQEVWVIHCGGALFNRL